MLKRFLFLVFVILFSFQFAGAQNKELRREWGKFVRADLDMAYYEQDSSAKSVILSDVGIINIDEVSSAYNAVLAQHRVIKVFDESAFKEGNIIIPYYSYKGSQVIRYLDVQVIMPNGTIQKVKSDNMFTEKSNKYWSAKKVFVPNLQKGCIIEWRMELISERLENLFDWDFQHEIPTRYSEVSVFAHPKFDYVTLRNVPDPVGCPLETNGKDGSVIYYSQYLPALNDEPFNKCLSDNKTKVQFQLSGIFRDIGRVPVWETWEKVARELDSDQDFGDQYNPKLKFSKDLWEAFIAEHDISKDSVLGIAEKALRFVTNHIKWDDSFRFYASKEHVDDIFKAKSGSSGPINLALISILRRAKLTVYPVLVSTQANGAMFTQYPILDQFNTTVALLVHNGQMYVLDATDPFIKLGHLRNANYNGMGWVCNRDKPEWIEFGMPEYSGIWLGNMQLKEDGSLRGRITVQADGPEARFARKGIAKDGAEKYIRTEWLNFTEIKIDSVMIAAEKEYNKPLKIDFYTEIPNAAEVANDFIYFSPAIHKDFKETPFKSVTRRLPVNMFPFRYELIMNVELPPGYKVEDLPKGERVMLPSGGGRVGVNCSQPSPTSFQLVIKNKLTKIDYSAKEYPDIRKYFDALVKNGNTQIVLKKQ